MSKFEKVLKPLRDIVINNFVGGISWAIGVTVGFSLVIFLLAKVFKNAGWIPFVGNFITDLTNYVLTNLQNTTPLVK